MKINQAMNKLFFFLLMLVGVYFWRRSLVQKQKRQQETSARPTQQTTVLREEVALMACAHCGVLIPQNDGVRSAEDFFCCVEHARLGRS